MSFSVNGTGTKIKRTLQVPRKISKNSNDHKIGQKSLQKRMRFSAFASLTVETALVLPLFVMIMVGILWIGQIVYLHLRIQMALEQTGKEFASYYYIVKAYREGKGEKGEQDFIAGELLEGIPSFAMAKNRIVETAGKEILDHSVIEKGSSGLSLLGSTFFQKDEQIDLTVSYKIKIPYLEFLKPISVTQRCVRRAWTGKEKGVETGEEIVYITETGKVYHTSLNCTYLKPSLKTINYDKVGEYRNESGAKFWPCERCAAGKSDETVNVVYITEYGNRYHFHVSCTALTRNIRSVKKSEVAGRPLCSKCAGGGV